MLVDISQVLQYRYIRVQAYFNFYNFYTFGGFLQLAKPRARYWLYRRSRRHRIPSHAPFHLTFRFPGMQSPAGSESVLAPRPRVRSGHGCRLVVVAEKAFTPRTMASAESPPSIDLKRLFRRGTQMETDHYPCLRCAGGCQMGAAATSVKMQVGRSFRQS